MLCPDLSGSYLCDSGRGRVTVTQTQVQENGNPAVIYTIQNEENKEVISTDGQQHPAPFYNDIENATYVASCDDGHLIYKVIGEATVEGKKYPGSVKSTLFRPNLTE